MPIDQAIFTSARTARAEGYHLVATSPGVTAEEARELSAWGPSHDSLYTRGADAESLNVHRLESGRFCVSQTVAAGNEYSDRGGNRVYTQCLLVPPADFARFANNAFSVARAALAKGVFTVYEHVPGSLAAVQLVGRAKPADAELLKRVTADVGPSALGRLLAAVLATSDCVGVGGTTDFDALVAALLNCLPVGCRPELSFTTGLTYSPRRTFRLVVLPDDLGAQRRLARQHGITAVDLHETPTEPAPRSGWAGYVAEMLAAGKFIALAAQIEQHAAIDSFADLDSLGNRLLRDGEPTPPVATSPSRQPAQRLADHVQHAHAPHPPGRESGRASATSAPTAGRPRTTGPCRELSPQTPAALELLGQLDDAVFDAIAGNEQALAQLKELWPRVLAEVGPEMVAESKEQYLRYTLTAWSEAGSEALRQPEQAATVLDVLCLLFEESN